MTQAETDGTSQSEEGKPSRRADPKLLQLLVCPLTKTPLHYDEARQELISRAARLAYPIREGVPIMMAEEARSLEDAELRNLGKR